MKRIPHISGLMTAFPWHLDVAVLASEARRFMQDHGIHHVPVTREGSRIAGIVEFDQIVPGSDATLAELLQPVRCVDAADRADQVLDLMAREHCSVVLVLHHERLAGIFTWTDACRLYADWLRQPFLPNGGGNDAA